MKLLLTALLCLLLAGCSPPAESPPTEAIPIPREIPDSLRNQYSREVEAVSLPLEEVQQILTTDDGLLLRSHNTLMLLDADFQPTASCTLDFEPEISHCGDTVSVFDSGSRTLFLLDLSLEEIRRLEFPRELSGSPVLAADEVYYCTDSGIYCWDPESGIRRRIRESVYDSQNLVGIHREDTVLQCRIREGQRQRDLFLDSQTGQLLQELDTTAQLDTSGGRYYCIFSSGSTENLLFSSDSGTPMEFFPESTASQTRFLPHLHAALTLENSVLGCYDLRTGFLRDTLTLHHIPKAILEWNEKILLLVSHDGQDILLLWGPRETPEQGTSRIRSHYTAEDPDLSGLRLCRDAAGTLSEVLGLDVLVWTDATAVTPWDYAFVPEHRPPVAQEQLQLLEACLSRYPKEILSQTAAHFDSLKFCLVQSISGTTSQHSLSTATGIQFLNGQDAHVVLAAGPYMEQALYHELFHVMESHILGRSNALDRWEELNPAGFSYDLDLAANSRRNSGVYLEGSHRAFVDTYSMSFPKEDRARIFEYAMLPDMEHLFRSSVMQSKLSAICTGIREAYGLKSTEAPLPWEQYLQ